MKSPVLSSPHLKEKIFAALILITLLVIYYNSVVIRGNSFLKITERSYQLGHYRYYGIYQLDSKQLATVDPVAANETILPSAYLENHYLRRFQFQLWNPYSGLGRPYNADMHSYTFFLPIYLFKLFPSLIMYDLFLLLRFFISGFFLFLLLRLYRCQFWIAIAGASFYMFNSYFHAFIDMDHINVTMFLSPMVYFVTKFLFSINKRYLIGFVLCSAGSFYAGNPNEFILIHLFVTLYFIFITYTKKILDFKKKFNFLLAYVVAVGLSILLSSVKLIPFIEFWENSISSRIGTVGTSDFLPLKKFLTWILFPDTLFGGPSYIGYLILSLLFYSFFNLARKKWKFREKIVAFHFILLFLVISKINNVAYIKWIGTLPILNNINYIKYCSLIYYAISVISALSLTYLLEDIKKTRNKIMRIVTFLLCSALPHLILCGISRKSFFQMAANSKTLLYGFIFFISIGLSMVIFRKIYSNNAVANCGVIILMILALLELRLNNHQYYGKRFTLNDKAPYTNFLLEQRQPFRAIGMSGTLMPNCNLIYPIPTINRIFAMRVKRPTIILSELVSSKFDSGMAQYYLRDEIWNNPYLDLLNTKYYISESIINSIVINPDYAISHEIKALMNNPSMEYTRLGNLYYYPHWGWQQLADSSADIPICLPYGDVYLKSTALAFNFDWRRREDPDNKLILTISIRQREKEEIVYKRTFIANRKEDQDFFNINADLSKYAGQDIVIHLSLRNPGAKNENDRKIFFGDLRITYNKKKESLPWNANGEKTLESAEFKRIPYEEVFSHHAIVYRNNRALDRGFILYDMKQIFSLDEAVDVMKKNPLIYEQTALIEGNPPKDIEIGIKGRSEVDFIDYRENYVKIEVETSENGVFILSDAYYPGWKAYLNNKKVRIYPAFGALRAVFLPKGRHELEFCYRPWTFSLGAVLTLFTLVFLGCLYFLKPKLTT